MTRKMMAFFMCIGLLFSTSATVFAQDSSVLWGKVTKMSQGKCFQKSMMNLFRFIIAIELKNIKAKEKLI